MSEFADPSYYHERPKDMHWAIHENSGGGRYWFECSVCDIRVENYIQHQEGERHKLLARAWWLEYEDTVPQKELSWR